MNKEPKFMDVICFSNMLNAYAKTQKGKSKFKYDAMKFKENEMSNLLNLQSSLIYGTYEHSGYTTFMVYEPKERLIYAPKYTDKIIQHMINNILRNYYEPKFIYDSYACIRNKGNQAAVLQIQNYQREAYKNYENPYLLKIDISKFFYTIDRDILKSILSRDISDKNLLILLFKIIDSFDQPLGLPLGNLTSQLFANIYLNEIDQLIKTYYNIEYYVRYADDMFIIVDGKDRANELKTMITNDITRILRLTVNPRKVYIKPAKSIDGLGFKIHTNRILLLGRNKIKLRLLLKKNNVNSLNSWYGYAHISNCYSLLSKNMYLANNISFTGNKFILKAL